MSKSCDIVAFGVGDIVVYPSHGVGKITAEENQVIGGTEIGVYVILFSKDKMILRVPKARARKAGLRHIASSSKFEEAMAVLKQKSKIQRGMWSKRAQEYEQKINSGDVLLIAEVLRDLHRNIGDTERSYSERVIYEAALERLSHEYAAATGLPQTTAHTKFVDILEYCKQ